MVSDTLVFILKLIPAKGGQAPLADESSQVHKSFFNNMPIEDESDSQGQPKELQPNSAELPKHQEIPDPTEMMEILKQPTFCSKLIEVAEITKKRKEAGLLISRSYQSPALHFSEVEEGNEKHAPVVHAPDGNYRVLWLHSHPVSPQETGIVAPSWMDLAIMKSRGTYDAIAGMLAEDQMGVLIYYRYIALTNYDHDIELRNEMAEEFDNRSLEGSNPFASQEEVIEALERYHDFVKFQKYTKKGGVYVPSD